MLDTRLRLRHLRCFLETARLGSLSAAADALSISQPAASKTIKELEDILGLSLFDRSHRRLSLTTSGKTFQSHTGAAMIELTRAQDLARALPKAPSKIAVGALPTASTQLLPDAALRFRTTHPACVLRISTGPNWMLLSQLREGRLDMVVGRMAGAADMEGLSFRQLYSERIAAVVRRDHPLLAHPAPVEQLDTYPLMLPPGGAVISPMVRAFLSRHGIAAHAPAMENVSLAFGRKVIQSSDMIWFISEGVVRAELESGTLTTLPMGDELLGGPVGISMREGQASGPEQKALVDILIQTASEPTATP